MTRKHRNRNVRGYWKSVDGPRVLIGEAMLVIGWGALIPGLLWLGGAAGF